MLLPYLSITNIKNGTITKKKYFTSTLPKWRPALNLHGQRLLFLLLFPQWGIVTLSPSVGQVCCILPVRSIRALSLTGVFISEGILAHLSLFPQTCAAPSGYSFPSEG